LLYCRDKQTGEHLVSHHGCEHRFQTRAEALAEARRISAEEKADSES
jgi:hypothetical protein